MVYRIVLPGAGYPGPTTVRRVVRRCGPRATARLGTDRTVFGLARPPPPAAPSE